MRFAKKEKIIGIEIVKYIGPRDGEKDWHLDTEKETDTRLKRQTNRYKKQQLNRFLDAQRDKKDRKNQDKDRDRQIHEDKDTARVKERRINTEAWRHPGILTDISFLTQV